MSTAPCKFCNCTIGDESPALLDSDSEYFGDQDFAPCDECGRVVCMGCAVFHFPEDGPVRMRYLCPDCGEPTHRVMERIGAPALPLEVSA